MACSSFCSTMVSVNKKRVFKKRDFLPLGCSEVSQQSLEVSEQTGSMYAIIRSYLGSLKSFEVSERNLKAILQT